MVRLPSTSLRTSRSPQGKILKNLRALLLVLPLLFSIFTLLSLGPAVPKAQAAVCPDFLDGSQATSDLAVNPNKVREVDLVSKVCNPIPLDPARALCRFVLGFFLQYTDIGDLALLNSRMPAYLRRANELTLSGELTDREEPGGITGALAKGLSPGYTQDGLDPIKELTESEGQLVTGTVTLNQVAPQEQFTIMPTYEDASVKAPPGYYELEATSKTGKALLQDYQVEGRFGEVAPLYDRFGLLKQMLFPPAEKTTKAAIPTVDCINYDPTIIAVRPTKGFSVADPDRAADWQAYVPITDPAEETVECPPRTTTYRCRVATDGYCRKQSGTCNSDPCNPYSPTVCPTRTYRCGASTLNCRVAADGYCRVQAFCPANDSCNPYSPTTCASHTYSCTAGYNCPAELAPESYEEGGNLDVQSKVSYASKAWERIGAPSTAPGEGGVFNVLLPPGSSFLTKEAEPQLDFDYDPYSMGRYSDNSTLNIADLGNVGGATSCIVNQLTAHPANAAYGTCEAALETVGVGDFTGWPTEHGCITQSTRSGITHANTDSIDIGSNRSISWAPLGQPAMATTSGTVEIACRDVGGCGSVATIGACAGVPSCTGRWVSIIPDTGGFKIWYFHLDSVSAFEGQKVSPGTIIGTVGYSGNVWPRGVGGTHLHYEFKTSAMAPPKIPQSPALGLCW